MKTIRTRRCYCVEMTVEQYRHIETKDKRHRAMEIRTLSETLEATTPARRVEYSGHFGAHVFYELGVDDDNALFRAAIQRIIRNWAA